MANVIEFTIRGVDRASGPLGRVSGAAGMALKVISGFAAATVAAATAVVGFTAKINAGIDHQAKFAKRIGESVVELTTLQHAADLSGISTQTFNMATQRMTRRVAEAARGTGEAAGALRELGIDAKQFNQLGLQDRMDVLADKMTGVASEGDRLRLAFKLFDAEGTAMLQMLGQGSEAMQAAAADARFLGIVIGEQAAANAEAFSDAMTRSGKALKGVSLGIAGELTPVLTRLIDKFADFVATARPAIIDFVKSAVKNVATLGVVLGQVYTSIKDFADRIFTKEGFQDFVDAAGQALRWLGKAFLDIGPILAATMFSTFKLVWETFAEMGKWGWQKVLDFYTGSDKAGSLADLLFDRIPQATEETRKTVSTMWDDLTSVSIAKGREATDALASSFGINVELASEQAELMIAKISEYGEVAKQVNEQVTESTLAAFAERTEAAIKMREEELERMIEYSESIQEIWLLTLETIFLEAQTLGETVSALIQETYDNLTKGIGDAVATAIVDGKNLSQAMGNILKTVLKNIISALVTMAIQRTVMSTVFTAASAREASSQLSSGLSQVYTNSFASAAAIPVVGWSMAPGIAATNAAIATAGAAASMAAGAGLGATAGAREHGGPVASGAAYLVGERGPEVFMPSQAGTIIPNDELGSMGGGVVIQGDVVIHVLENATSAEALLAMDDREVRDIVAAQFIPALDALARQGITPEYIKRKGQ